MFFPKKKHITDTYDKENQIPVIRASICTGEQVAGFKDIHLGKFQEVMLIKNTKDLDMFKQRYGITEEIEKKKKKKNRAEDYSSTRKISSTIRFK